MTKSIGYLNNKGGPGKTTAAYYTAARWAAQGKAVTLIDMDGQCNLTDLVAPGSHEIGIADVLANQASLEQAIMPVAMPTGGTVRLVQASGDLYDIEAELNTGLGVMRLYNALRQADDLLGDVCVIDTPPHLGSLTLSVIVAVGLLRGWLVIPAIPVKHSVIGIESIRQKIAEARGIPGCDPRILGVIATQTRNTNIHDKWLAALRSDLYPPLIGETPFRGAETVDFDLRDVYAPVADVIWKMMGGE